MKHVKFLLVSLLVTLCMNANAQGNVFEHNGIYYEYEYDYSSWDGENYKVKDTIYVGYKGDGMTGCYSGDVVIPAKVNIDGRNYVVGGIRWGAFRYSKDMTSIELPSTIKTIESETFSSCSSLTSITIPDGVTTIESSAFYGCSSLTSITIPNNVKTIGSGAFSSCSSLTSVTIPDGVSTIETNAFYNCNALKEVTLGKGVIKIGNDAFNGCYSLTDVHMYSGVKTIESYAFGTLSSLNIHLETATDAIKNFLGIKGLNNLMRRPEGMDSGWNYRDNHMFVNGKEVIDLEIPESITTIPAYAFYGCRGFNSVSLPSTLTKIGNSAFDIMRMSGDDNVGLSAIYYNGTADKWMRIDSLENITRYEGNDKELYLKEETATRAITGLSKVKYLNLSKYTSLTTIPRYAFANFKNILDVTLPVNLRKIEEGAFAGASRLHVIYINSTIIPSLENTNAIPNTTAVFVPREIKDNYATLVNWKTLYDNSQITTGTEYINFTATVTAENKMSALHKVIGDENLASVINLTVKGTINSYDIMIIRNKMPLLKTLDLTDATFVANPYPYLENYTSRDNETGDYAFSNLKINTIKLPTNLKRINEGAFANSNVEEVIIPSAQVIGKKAFYRCRQLESLTMPENLTRIEASAFEATPVGQYDTYNMSGLKHINFDAVHLLEYIGERAFAYSRLDTLDILNQECDVCIRGGVIKDGWDGSYVENRVSDPMKSAFFGCKSLVRVSLPGGLKEIEESMFNSCSNLQEAIIPNTVETIRDYAFGGREDWTVSYENESGYWEMIYVYGATNLKHVEIIQGSKLKTIGENAFRNCYSLADFAIPARVRSIGDYAFAGCRSLEEMTIAPGVTELGNYMFADCSSLRNVSMPSTVTRIGDYAFKNCTKLEVFKIPSSMVNIGNFAFNGCTALKDIYSYTVEPTKINTYTFDTWTSAHLHIPFQAFYIYYYDTQWSRFLQIDNFFEPFDYFYLNGDLVLDEHTGVFEGDPQVGLNPGSGLIFDPSLKEEQTLSDVHYIYDGSMAPSIISNGHVSINEGSVFNMEIEVEADRWYFFCFPFNVRISEIEAPGSYIFRYYDGGERAVKGVGYAWKKIPDTDLFLTYGTGYIFQTNTAGTLVLPVSNPKFDANDKMIELDTFASTQEANASWNFIGNPCTSYYDMDDLGSTGPITVWDGYKYVAYRPGDDNYILKPFEAFFRQKSASGEELLVWKNELQATYSKANFGLEQKALARMRSAKNINRQIINLTVSNGDREDNTRVVFNKEQSAAYEAACDAAKFLSTESVPQLYTIDASNVKYAINERPEGSVQLGFIANKDGFYTISASRMDAPVMLYDNVTGSTYDLQDGDYVFSSKAGSFDNRFLLIVNNESTGIAALQEQTGVVLSPESGALWISGADNAKVDIYNAAGTLVSANVGNGLISLSKGVHIVKVNGVSTKVLIK